MIVISENAIENIKNLLSSERLLQEENLHVCPVIPMQQWISFLNNEIDLFHKAMSFI